VQHSYTWKLTVKGNWLLFKTAQVESVDDAILHDIIASSAI